MNAGTPRHGKGSGGRSPRRGRSRAATLLVLLAGIVAVGYGVWMHSTDVWLKPEAAAQPPPEAAASDETLKMMGFAPPPKAEAAEGPKTIVELEPALVREVSVGGVTREVASGTIQRTYSGDAPTQCPT